jgi:hypothetical protein
MINKAAVIFRLMVHPSSVGLTAGSCGFVGSRLFCHSVDGQRVATVRQKTDQFADNPSECWCSRVAAEAAKVDLGWLVNAAFLVKSH